LGSCAHFWLAGARVEPTSISPFVWKLPAHQEQGCDRNAISALRFSNWASNQPDNGGDKSEVREACLAMLNTNSRSLNQWDDRDCDERTCAICEYQEDDDDVDVVVDPEHH